MLYHPYEIYDALSCLHWKVGEEDDIGMVNVIGYEPYMDPLCMNL